MAKAYVIVGGSLAGATAAITLREEGADGSVTLIGAEREPPVRAPSAVQGLPARRSAVRQGARAPGCVSTQNTASRRCSESAQPASTLPRGSSSSRIGRRVPFDVLLIATGGRNRRISIPGSELEGIYSLRTVEDADRIKAEIAPGRRVVVVGMGFIGSEVAASLRQKGPGGRRHRPGEDAVVPRAGRGRRSDASPTSIALMAFGPSSKTPSPRSKGHKRVARVLTKGGLRLECDFVVAGIGIEPVVDFLDGTGVEVDNGVVVDQYCQTNVPGIYAAGDVANHYHPVFERQIRVEHWHNAIKQGAAAARNMLGRAVPYDEIHWFWSDQYDANLQYAGFHTKWEQLVVRGRLDSGSFLAFYVNDGRIDAVVGLNRAKDVRRAIPLIKARRMMDLAQLQDESIDLRSLAPTNGR